MRGLAQQHVLEHPNSFLAGRLQASSGRARQRRHQLLASSPVCLSHNGLGPTGRQAEQEAATAGPQSQAQRAQSTRDVRAAAAQTLNAAKQTNDKPGAQGPALGRSRTMRKIDRITSDDIGRTVHAVILAGGPSDNPLARFRAMPAVELGSNIQLIDIPISNCISSGINKMYVLTQFNSHTLNTHITTSYPPAVFGGPKKQGFVDVLACHQTPEFNAWYRGSADAVRRNLPVILEQYRGAGVPDELLILSGQAIYRMDYVELIKTHRENDADITIATHSVGWGQASRRGLTRVDPDTGLVTHFHEKPTGSRLESMAHASKHATPDDPFEASMGVYVFKRDVLVKLLQTNEDHFGSDAGPDTHFGHDVIPHALRENHRVVAHHFGGYWRELSSLRDFFEVNLELARPNAPISVFDVDETIVSRGHILPPAIVHNCEIHDTLLGEGSVLNGSKLSGCIVGCNSYIGNGCELVDTMILGNDTYTNDVSRASSRKKGEVVLGIGEGSVIKNAVVDSNAAVGRNVRITNEAGVKEADHSQGGYVIQDGIVVILKGAIIADNTRI